MTYPLITIGGQAMTITGRTRTPRRIRVDGRFRLCESIPVLIVEPADITTQSPAWLETTSGDCELAAMRAQGMMAVTENIRGSAKAGAATSRPSMGSGTPVIRTSVP